LYKRKRDKRYYALAAGDIIRVRVPVGDRGYIIEPGEMFEYIESVRTTLYRVRRISNGKVYKIYASKFIRQGSLSYVWTWEEVAKECIWNKKK